MEKEKKSLSERLAEKQKLTVKCDNPDCKWKIDVTVDGLDKWINQPCPECGYSKRPVLTEKEARLAKYAALTADAWNKIAEKIPGKKSFLSVEIDTSPEE